MDIALKQRLVGASVLIALAVVVLPMLLGGRPEEGEPEAQTIELPPQPAELDFETRRFPVGQNPSVTQRTLDEEARKAAEGDLPPTLPQPDEDHRAEPLSAPPGEPLVEPGAEPHSEPGAVTHVELAPRETHDALQGDDTGAQDTPGATADAATVAKVARGPAAGTPEPTATRSGATVGTAGGGRYVVQVASFGSMANATRLASTLRDSGYSVLTDTVSADVGTLHRVRVGPYVSEAEATAAVGQLRQRISDVRPRVVDLQPEQAAQVTTPSDPLVRWVVQLGSFSSAGNADRLVERVRAEGLSAYKETVSSAGSTVYRVRVGPFVERDEAIRVDGLIAERLSVDGVVMSAD